MTMRAAVEVVLKQVANTGDYKTGIEDIMFLIERKETKE